MTAQPTSAADNLYDEDIVLDESDPIHATPSQDDEPGDNDAEETAEASEAAAAAATGAKRRPPPTHDPTAPCALCGKALGRERAPTTKDGAIHVGCVLQYKFLHQPRCCYCDVRFLDSESTVYVKDEATGKLYHPECRQQVFKGVAYVRPTKEGAVRKFSIARSKLSRHNWKTRYFILSPMYDGLRYFKTNPHDDKSAGPAPFPSGSTDEDEADTDADPALLGDKADKAKGVVPLDGRRARLITHPAASVYKISSSSASLHNDIAIIFYDSPESSTERRLLFQCKDGEEKRDWVRALEGYLHMVDDPKDYGAGKDADKKKK